MPSIINATTTGGVVVSGDNSGSLQLQNSGVTELTVASTGVTVADDLSFNSGYGSSAVAYGCRAWVNFNGTGTVAIRGSGNVTSITDRGTGEYTINFTTAMPDANYCGVASATVGGSDNNNRCAAVGPNNTSSAFCNSWVTDSGSQIDVAVICASIFR